MNKDLWAYGQYQSDTKTEEKVKVDSQAWYDKPIDHIRAHMTSRLVNPGQSDVLQTDYVIGSPLNHQDPFIQ